MSRSENHRRHHNDSKVPDDKGWTWAELEQYLAQDTRTAAIDVGNFMRRAMLELAFEMGGQELVNQVGPTILDRTTILPGLAFAEFEHNRPGISDTIMNRVEKIRSKKHREDYIRVLTHRQPRPSHALLEDPLTPKKKILSTFFKKK